jgi:hypothetical protein
MLKKLGLSAAMIFASVAFAQPAAMAANWNNGRGNQGHFDARNDHRDNRDVRDFRGDNRYVAREEHERFVERVPVYRARPELRFAVGFGSRNVDYR